MAKRISGLHLRNNVWHIDKRIRGYGRLRETTGCSDRHQAEQILAKRVADIFGAVHHGTRPKRTFAQAANKYLADNQHKATLWRDAYSLKALLPYIGQNQLDRISNDSFNKFKADRQKAGRSAGTINKDLAIVRVILNKACRLWRDDTGLTWLHQAPLIEDVPGNSREPYPLTWTEQDQLFNELPAHLQRMALFAVNTGCRQAEVCGLRWEWEQPLPELGISVFLIPGDNVKNGQHRLVVLNSIAKSVIAEQRGKHDTYVFTYMDDKLERINNSAWRKACKRTGIPARVHDLKHTFGARLRAADVSFEDRQDLLGHKSQRITTHYSAKDVAKLLEAAEKATTRRKHTTFRVVDSGHTLDTNSTNRHTPAVTVVGQGQ